MKKLLFIIIILSMFVFGCGNGTTTEEAVRELKSSDPYGFFCANHDYMGLWEFMYMEGELKNAKVCQQSYGSNYDYDLHSDIDELTGGEEWNEFIEDGWDVFPSYHNAFTHSTYVTRKGEYTLNAFLRNGKPVVTFEEEYNKGSMLVRLGTDMVTSGTTRFQYCANRLLDDSGNIKDDLKSCSDSEKFCWDPSKVIKTYDKLIQSPSDPNRYYIHGKFYDYERDKNIPWVMYFRYWPDVELPDDEFVSDHFSGWFAKKPIYYNALDLCGQEKNHQNEESDEICECFDSEYPDCYSRCEPSSATDDYRYAVCCPENTENYGGWQTQENARKNCGCEEIWESPHVKVCDGCHYSIDDNSYCAKRGEPHRDTTGMMTGRLCCGMDVYGDGIIFGWVLEEEFDEKCTDAAFESLQSNPGTQAAVISKDADNLDDNEIDPDNLIQGYNWKIGDDRNTLDSNYPNCALFSVPYQECSAIKYGSIIQYCCDGAMWGFTPGDNNPNLEKYCARCKQ